jgi:hypothetical protein
MLTAESMSQAAHAIICGAVMSARSTAFPGTRRG